MSDLTFDQYNQIINEQSFINDLSNKQQNMPFIDFLYQYQTNQNIFQNEIIDKLFTKISNMMFVKYEEHSKQQQRINFYQINTIKSQYQYAQKDILKYIQFDVANIFDTQQFLDWLHRRYYLAPEKELETFKKDIQYQILYKIYLIFNDQKNELNFEYKDQFYINPYMLLAPLYFYGKKLSNLGLIQKLVLFQQHYFTTGREQLESVEKLADTKLSNTALFSFIGYKFLFDIESTPQLELFVTNRVISIQLFNQLYQQYQQSPQLLDKYFQKISNSMEMQNTYQSILKQDEELIYLENQQYIKWKNQFIIQSTDTVKQIINLLESWEDVFLKTVAIQGRVVYYYFEIPTLIQKLLFLVNPTFNLNVDFTQYYKSNNNYLYYTYKSMIITVGNTLQTLKKQDVLFVNPYTDVFFLYHSLEELLIRNNVQIQQIDEQLIKEFEEYLQNYSKSIQYISQQKQFIVFYDQLERLILLCQFEQSFQLITQTEKTFPEKSIIETIQVNKQIVQIEQTDISQPIEPKILEKRLEQIVSNQQFSNFQYISLIDLNRITNLNNLIITNFIKYKSTVEGEIQINSPVFSTNLLEIMQTTIYKIQQEIFLTLQIKQYQTLINNTQLVKHYIVQYNNAVANLEYEDMIEDQSFSNIQNTLQQQINQQNDKIRELTSSVQYFQEETYRKLNNINSKAKQAIDLIQLQIENILQFSDEQQNKIFDDISSNIQDFIEQFNQMEELSKISFISKDVTQLFLSLKTQFNEMISNNLISNAIKLVQEQKINQQQQLKNLTQTSNIVNTILKPLLKIDDQITIDISVTVAAETLMTDVISSLSKVPDVLIKEQISSKKINQGFYKYGRAFQKAIQAIQRQK